MNSFLFKTPVNVIILGQYNICQEQKCSILAFKDLRRKKNLYDSFVDLMMKFVSITSQQVKVHQQNA